MIGKYLVIGAVLAGAIAFFLPLLVFTTDSVKGSGSVEHPVSMMAMMQGVEGLKNAMAEQESEIGAVDTSAMKEMEKTFDEVKTILLIPFVPVGLFLLIVLIGIKRFGRGLGVFALIVGLISLALWALVNGVLSEAGPDAKATLGSGFTLLLVSYLLGTVGGIMGIVKPQPKPEAAA